jgi:spore coat protein U-like protein
MSQRSIHRKCSLWLGTGALFALAGQTHAAMFCSASSAGFTSPYIPSNPTDTVTAASVSVTCSRDYAGKDLAEVTYQLAADNGLNPTGTQNRAFLGTSLLNYDVASTSACAPWDSTNLLPIPEASFQVPVGSTATHTTSFYVCIPAGQAMLPPEGTYTDIITISFANEKATGGGNATFTGGAFPVSIIAPASCSFTTPPSNVEFTYTAFSPSDVLANSSFGVKCSTNLPYTMTLDAAVDVVAGLSYSLTLNTTGSGGSNPLTSVGIGLGQTFYINGRMAAGQAGACTGASCIESQVRTLMISY